MSVRIMLLGAPGAGKGTQARRVCERLGLAHLSTGDQLRAAVAAGTPAGTEAASYIDAGQLVPDEIVFGVLFEQPENRLSSATSSPSIILITEPSPRRIVALPKVRSRLERIPLSER